MLVNGKEVLNYAVKNKIAIPAFGAVNLEGVKAICKAAENTNVPIILQMTEGGINYAGLNELYSTAVAAAKESRGQICIHVDHGRSIKMIKKAIDLGFSSVMYDGSHLSIEENIANAKIIKDYIGNRAVSLEVEIGQIGGKEDDLESEEAKYASIEEVVKMNKDVDPDSIAVAVGTAHGVYKGEININYDLIRECFSKCDKPIVLHGTSGVPSEMVKEAIRNGVRKVNYDTELKQNFIKETMSYMQEHSEEYDIRKIFKPGIEAMADIVELRIKECTEEIN